MFENLNEAPQLVGKGLESRAVAATMAQAWVNFARTGNPSQSALPWPRYENEKRLTMTFASRSQIISDPDGKRREYWTAIRARRT